MNSNKEIKIEPIVEKYYKSCSNLLGKYWDKIQNPNTILSGMYEKILRTIGMEKCFVYIEEIERSNYKITLKFANGNSYELFSNTINSKDEVLKNVENMRNTYFQMLEETEEMFQEIEI